MIEGQTTEEAYISSPCEPKGSSKLKILNVPKLLLDNFAEIFYTYIILPTKV